jgi:hypothetical protein
MADSRFCSEEMLCQFKASRAVAPTVETGNVDTGQGTRILLERGSFVCSTRISPGGATTAPQELNAGELVALLSSLREQLSDPPTGLDVDALQTFVDLISRAVTYEGQEGKE